MHTPGPRIVLTGFMGTGKSTIGRALARATGLDFVDTDGLIVERHGPIADIFASLGEQAFRRIERAVADELADRHGVVVSTGGRFMLDEHNASVLGEASTVVALTASAATILDRVESEGVETRPLLADADDPLARIEQLLDERRDGYGRFDQIDTDGRTVDEIVDELITRIS